ncbi:MAG: rRNA pseudouridine synthase [Deltaproteobacteria bacterium]|nr:rRNA pseudouridine synthase [Deltaproteobacteria bacterium]MBI2341216.1 rRNA pseudouridine synthase [Deltaproteobacteria bacterium]MBI2975130.1 rRNA pseudouridine synthase [Deltaproteobacteria bacterium]
MERLQKILAKSTSLSRRAAEEAIKNGFVSVNGHVVTKLGTKADAIRDKITVSGKIARPVRYNIYIAFNKPRNTIVSKSDPEGRPTIWNRLSTEMKESLNSAGRLDFDSEGLILLTNDGDMINKITHPSGKVSKTYLVKTSGIPDESGLKALKEGIVLEDGKTQPAAVKIIRKTEKNATLEISIREGRNREVRRMFARIGCPVTKLRRISIGTIRLGSLKPGAWRYLAKQEIFNLRKLF